jgi:hypothetical protein
MFVRTSDGSRRTLESVAGADVRQLPGGVE